jgi:hypothetical protein
MKTEMVPEPNYDEAVKLEPQTFTEPTYDPDQEAAEAAWMKAQEEEFCCAVCHQPTGENDWVYRYEKSDEDETGNYGAPYWTQLAVCDNAICLQCARYAAAYCDFEAMFSRRRDLKLFPGESLPRSRNWLSESEVLVPVPRPVTDPSPYLFLDLYGNSFVQ